MIIKKIRNWLFALALLVIPTTTFAQEPVRIGIDGLTHDHVHGILGMVKKGNAPFVLVGIAESNRDIVDRLAQSYGFDKNIVFDNIDEMVEKTKPQGVVAFNSIYGHLNTVEACAPKGIHVMVEKPLAVNMEHAKKMAGLARQNNILLLTNYETTWYPSNHKVYETIVEKNTLGDIRKVIVCDGHEGPKEIGCSQDFLDWLTDPVMNGGGAVVDFGCYGANLMTWLMKNERPETVSATLQQIKPDVYPKVDDEATIVLIYPKAQAILQGSWNWPFSRKDMEVYTTKGYMKALDANTVNFREHGKEAETEKSLSLPYGLNDPFHYFTEAIRGNIKVSPEDLSSLENNLIVVEILDAARQSARTGQVIKLK